jgi:ribosomal protein S18 acetylase RimI-like enzyme
MILTTLAAAHAPDAARLHIAGQPGTFLTTLGPDVLTVFYRALPTSPVGFGYAALADRPIADEAPAIQSSMIGFVSATTSTARLFGQMGTHHLSAFLPPLCRRFVQKPSLIWYSAQTLLYPLLTQDRTHRPAGARAELLSIMVEPGLRGQGVGAQLMQALLAECAARQIDWLEVTVDASNTGAQRFYTHHAFQLTHQFTLFGRAMVHFARSSQP